MKNIKLYPWRLEICKNNLKHGGKFLVGNTVKNNSSEKVDFFSFYFSLLYFYNEKKMSKNAFSSCIIFNISFYCIFIREQTLVFDGTN